MSNIFFTGCTHFDHARIIDLCNRPFVRVEDMNEAMIERWNSVVKPEDTVYHLGDFGYIKDADRTEELLKQLNGVKILLYGNHDENTVTWSHGWFMSKLYHEMTVNKRKIVLFHYPIEDWNGRYKGSIHLHCHTHGKDFRNPVDKVGPTGSNRFNIGVDACNFTPVSLEDILKAAEA